ncbi:uncharacterized protein LOC106176489 [Lingula anatina]|uniref:Uncharacterized protein LOC106176489 n=1 Tax=Lingula anatina TaxID=7574 RepID=A0A1S3JWA4_LINAN|nr:uncharacterized protein LOC106176489 [Lingula anatina]|eukprot:XP_013414351.1 uncharacterized protein LOC106176489 [Lingula anatina]
MATASVLEETRDDVLTCQICFEAYVSPKALPCLHTFCQGCLEDYAQTRLVDVYGQFPCPTCRRDIQIGSGGVAALPDNFILGKVRDLLNKPRRRSQEWLDECSICSSVSEASTSAATHHCFQCDKKLCDRCHRLHRQVSVTRDHHTEEIGKTGDSFYCKQHPRSRVEYYCGSHHICICVTCTMHQHQYCDDVIPLQVAMETRVHTLLLMVTEVEERKGRLENKRSHYKTLQDNITVKMENLDTQIDQAATLVTLALSPLESNHSAECLSLADCIEQQLKEFLAQDTSGGVEGDYSLLGQQISVRRQVREEEEGEEEEEEEGEPGGEGEVLEDTSVDCRVQHTFHVPGGKTDCCGLLVATTSQHIAISQPTSDHVYIFTMKGHLTGQYGCPTRVGLCTHGDNFVSLSVSSRLLGLGRVSCTCVQYDPRGSVQSQTPLCTGWLDGKPQGLNIYQNQIFVTFKNKTVKIFDIDGRAVKSFCPLDAAEYLDLAYFAVGGEFMYVLDANNQCVIKCNHDGEMVKKFSMLASWMQHTARLGGLCMDNRGEKIILTDSSNSQLFVLDGCDTQQPRQFLGIADGIYRPRDVTLTPGGALVVAQEHPRGPQVVVIHDVQTVLQKWFGEQEGPPPGVQARCNIQ